MLAPASGKKQKPAHVVVFGNEKGGTGKSTVAMHVVVALLKANQTVAVIDLDNRQQSLGRYIENRRIFSGRRGFSLDLPEFYKVRTARQHDPADSEAAEFAAFAEAISTCEHQVDFIVIDTPGSDGYLMRLAHSMADTLVTPLNDSYVDLDVLGRIDCETLEIITTSHYAEMVKAARRQRRLVDNALTDWVVLRNRLGSLESRNQRFVGESLKELSLTLGFRLADGLSERVIYRSLFPMGLTSMDSVSEEIIGTRPTISHLSARQDVLNLLRALRLPINAENQSRAERRAEWLRASSEPLDTHGLID